MLKKCAVFNASLLIIQEYDGLVHSSNQINSSIILSLNVSYSSIYGHHLQVYLTVQSFTQIASV